MDKKTVVHDLTMLYLETNNSAKDITSLTFAEKYLKVSREISTAISESNENNWLY